ncbi:MAG: hypothetical protein R2684_05355 [Pyrinomonadaceae bacterium]
MLVNYIFVVFGAVVFVDMMVSLIQKYQRRGFELAARDLYENWKEHKSEEDVVNALWVHTSDYAFSDYVNSKSVRIRVDRLIEAIAEKHEGKNPI